MNICLNMNRYKKPWKFWQYACMNLNLFFYQFKILTHNQYSKIILVIKNLNYFYGNQLLATLIYIKNYKNIAFLTKIRDLGGIKKGIVNQVYYQIIIVIQSSNLQTL